MSWRSSAAGQRRSSNSWIAFALRPLPSAFELIKRRRAAGGFCFFKEEMGCEWSKASQLELNGMNGVKTFNGLGCSLRNGGAPRPSGSGMKRIERIEMSWMKRWFGWPAGPRRNLKSFTFQLKGNSIPSTSLFHSSTSNSIKKVWLICFVDWNERRDWLNEIDIITVAIVKSLLNSIK